jgi:GNAT superfamily N-acetyltransferase
VTGLSAQVRPAVPGDAAVIARVHVETWRASYAGVVPDSYLVAMNEREQRRMWRRQIATRGWAGSVLVAEAPDVPGPARGDDEGCQVVGFGSCGVLRGTNLPFKAEIYTLYVAGDWQGRGIGRSLLAGLFQSLLRSGLPSAYLWVLSRNPSRFFYEAMGGARVAERQERFAGSWLEETAYGWSDLRRWLAAQDARGDAQGDASGDA